MAHEALKWDGPAATEAGISEALFWAKSALYCCVAGRGMLGSSHPDNGLLSMSLLEWKCQVLVLGFLVSV